MNHVLQTVKIKKKCLDAFDDKRYILKDWATSHNIGLRKQRHSSSLEQVFGACMYKSFRILHQSSFSIIVEGVDKNKKIHMGTTANRFLRTRTLSADTYRQMTYTRIWVNTYVKRTRKKMSTISTLVISTKTTLSTLTKITGYWANSAAKPAWFHH